MNKSENKVSETVIRRLPIYHRYLNEIIDKGIDRISSKELSNLTGFTASQIRQDLNNFGGFGQQGYGYNTKDLRDQLAAILGLNIPYKAVVIGAGRLGSAIVRYSGFSNNEFKIVYMFDSNPDFVGEFVQGVEVLDVNTLEEVVEKEKIDIGIITVPNTSTQEIVDKLVSAGISGIWNFAPIDISVPDDIIVENVRLNDSLLTLFYYLKEKKN